jgi:hypothetical protein
MYGPDGRPLPLSYEKSSRHGACRLQMHARQHGTARRRFCTRSSVTAHRGGDHVRRTRASSYTCALVLGTLCFPHETSGAKRKPKLKPFSSCKPSVTQLVNRTQFMHRPTLSFLQNTRSFSLTLSQPALQCTITKLYYLLATGLQLK